MSTWRLSILMPPGFWSFNLVWTKIGWILTYNSFAWLPEISWKIQRSNYQSHLACSHDPTTNSKSLNPEFSQNFNYRGSPTYTKITNMVSTTMVFGLCMCMWGISALVGDLLQSHKFYVTRFFPSPKMHIRRAPSLLFILNLTDL